MKSSLSIKAVLLCFFRSNMINLAYNLRGLQNLGFIYALLPALQEIHKDEQDFLAACKRYIKHHHCHAFWTPYLVGAFLNLENKVAQGLVNPDFVTEIKHPALNSLSAIGDSFLNGSFNISLILFLISISLFNVQLAFYFAILWFVLALCAKFFIYICGLKMGLASLLSISRANLINCSRYVKFFNASLLALLFAIYAWMLPEELKPDNAFEKTVFLFALPMCFMLTFAYLVMRLHIARFVIVLLVFIVSSLAVYRLYP